MGSSWKPLAARLGLMNLFLPLWDLEGEEPGLWSAARLLWPIRQWRPSSAGCRLAGEEAGASFPSSFPPPSQASFRPTVWYLRGHLKGEGQMCLSNLGAAPATSHKPLR